MARVELSNFQKTYLRLNRWVSYVGMINFQSHKKIALPMIFIGLLIFLYNSNSLISIVKEINCLNLNLEKQLFYGFSDFNEI